MVRVSELGHPERVWIESGEFLGLGKDGISAKVRWYENGIEIVSNFPLYAFGISTL